MQRLIRSFLIFATFIGYARADYVEVRRPATVKLDPSADAEIVDRPSLGRCFALIESGRQTEGYYRIQLPLDLGVAAQDGWIYRTLVRRFPGDLPQSELRGNSTVSAADAATIDATPIKWPPRDDASDEPHTIFGEPIYKDHDGKHDVVRNYSGFTVYWDDEVLGPRWTAIKLTAGMIDANDSVQRLLRFSPDSAIEDAGLQTTRHDDYKNPPGSRDWARGHMVQFDDARGWGEEAARESFYTSNITPQLQALNGKRWLALEELCSEYARDYGLVWVYSGPVYGSNPKPFATGRRVPSPVAFYKIVVSPGENNDVDVQAFLVPHREFDSDVKLSTFLVSVDQIEQATRINFLAELPDSVEAPLEAAVWGLWPDK
jgi:endonuclease G